MRYLRLYLAFAAANFKELMAYRASFYSGVLITLVWVSVSVIAVLIYSSQASTLSGWTRQELIGLTGTFSIITGFSYTLFLQSFFKLVEKIHKGTFDYDLMRPIDSQFMATLSRMAINNIARFLAGIVLVVIGWPHGVPLWDIAKYVVFLVVACLTLYSLWVLFVSLNFFSERMYNIVDFLLELFDSLGRTPSDTLKEASSWLFTFLLPFVMVLSFPVKSLWGTLSTVELVELLGGGLLLFVFARLFWQFSLRHYTSASS